MKMVYEILKGNLNALVFKLRPYLNIFFQVNEVVIMVTSLPGSPGWIY